ncbi:CesT family type III secretion system chaperone [Xylophilus sp. GOD-11R]|uniref:CesT family type III secretion system chaperone n=1 Tax=Xylophilus sp. GOD-11R TaxID=3089814 RepID=UPI00298C02FA|nr:CesT family type III secretion system chaperone [Xylophilus sp. GOD-11R]WPB57937.1 CesT family type III secretion system chaperone [Xylophilus sp. GOD-11R]
MAEEDKLTDLLREFCDTVGLYPPEILRRKQVQVKGMEVNFTRPAAGAEHFFFSYQFGAIAAGRTLKVFRLMLEANILVYAKDDAVIGMDPDTGGVVLSVRGTFGPGATGRWLADTLAHFAEHAIYWRKNILDCIDEMFNGISSGKYQWMRA